MLTTYHNHTIWSDGHASLDAMIAGAEALGVDELGISDHYVLYPGSRRVDWSMPLEFLADYVEKVLVAAAASRVTVRLGVEADFIPETIDNVRQRLAQFPFDYLIGSVHFAGDFPIDMEAQYWEELTVEARNEKWRQYWELIRGLAESRVFDFVGHLDLPKKFGYRPTCDLAAEAHAALDAIADAGMAIEINTAGWEKPVHEAYPSLDLLKEARRRNIPLVINADAHRPEDLTLHFPRARELAHEAGYREVVRYEQRKRVTVPL